MNQRNLRHQEVFIGRRTCPQVGSYQVAWKTEQAAFRNVTFARALSVPAHRFGTVGQADLQISLAPMLLCGVDDLLVAGFCLRVRRQHGIPRFGVRKTIGL